MDDRTGSLATSLSWNTFLSRTSLSSLSCAVFSDKQNQAAYSLGDVIRTLPTLNLRHYRYKELVREEALGEGETYLVERCAAPNGGIFAVKHLKTGDKRDDKTFQRRLRSVIQEVHIMKHPPLRAHPNFPSVFGYGWNIRDGLVVPYIVVEYTPLGTLREYVKSKEVKLNDLEILLGDVTSALGALHTCGIVHGDVKLDNVLVLSSWDRPAKALAKLTDFGHALVLNTDGRSKDTPPRYRGTLMYNAPEVASQDIYPIDAANLPKCDIWAFGLLVWEACIAGEEYLAYLERNGKITEAQRNGAGINPTLLLKCAKAALPPQALGAPMFLRIALHKTIQEDPENRVLDARSLPLVTRWNEGNLNSLEADLALHIVTPSPTFEMFRVDNGKEITWVHQEEIFSGLKRTYENKLTKKAGAIAWQIALCYHTGFGTARSARDAYEYSHIAKSEGHPVSEVFGDLLDLNKDARNNKAYEDTYSERIAYLLMVDPGSSRDMPVLVKACCEGNAYRTLRLLSQGASLNSSTIDGCSLFHWLFTFRGSRALDQVVERLKRFETRHLVNIPSSTPRDAHCQWPLKLVGSPLSVAISVNSLDTVRALVGLGADPFMHIHDASQFPPQDPRSQWTAFHAAARFHCSDILRFLVARTTRQKLTSLTSLGCALSFSTSLERLAIHGPDRATHLDETIEIIRSIQPITDMAPNGMTALVQAIDFQDCDVVSALLRAHPRLATTPFCSPDSQDIFSHPIHFAAQIAARYDTPETLVIPKLINSYTEDTHSSGPSLRDSKGRSQLHLAVAGVSKLTARWILEERTELLLAEDSWGRAPLHYCASTANCHLLLDKGAEVDQADSQGMTPLHRASVLGDLELVQAFLKWKPNLNLKDNIYGTPLHCGIISGSLVVVMALLEAGAPIDATDKMGNAPIHVAARLDRHNILRVLMRRGADIKAKNSIGRDAEGIAMDEGRWRSVGTLKILRSSRKDRVEEIFSVDSDTERDFGFSAEGPQQKQAPNFLWESEQPTIVEVEDAKRAVGDDYATEQDVDLSVNKYKELENIDRILDVLAHELAECKALKMLLDGEHDHLKEWQPVELS